MSSSQPYKCAVCGSDAPGRRYRIKGSKYICRDCRTKLDKDLSSGEWSRMNAAELKEFLSDKERLSMQKTCSFCGKDISADDMHKILLKDRSVLCGNCAGSMRIVRPVFNTVKSDGSGGYEPAADDPLKELTLEDVPWVQKEAAEERERRIARYGAHKAVFVVDDVTRYEDEDDAHEIYGTAVLGCIEKGDTLHIKRREGEYSKVVERIDPLEYDKKAVSLTEGSEGNLLVKGDVSFIYPGDVLTTERL